jgi:molybdopterin synthase catalytic subunit
MSYLHLTKEQLDLGKIFSNFHHPAAGGIVLFSGEVRNHHQGRSVAFLEYEAYEPMAEKMITRILEEAKKKWELHLAFCMHRLGRLEISDSAIVVLTATSHRSEAFEANRWIVDRIKHEAPIWKKETFTDGTFDWVMQCEGCTFESEFLEHKQFHKEPILPYMHNPDYKTIDKHAGQQQQ